MTTGTCGSTGDHVIKLFADWNNDGEFSGTEETVAVSAVLPASSTFSGNIQVPEELVPGAILRLRVVSVRTSSEEHTSELQSLMRISYAVLCLKKTQHHNVTNHVHSSSQH